MDSELTRDEKGDAIMPKLPDDFWQKQRIKRWTYVWQFKDSHGFFLHVDYDGLPDDEIAPHFPRFELETVKLFPSPDNPPWDEWIHKCNAYEACLNRYFKEVLAFKQIEQAHDLKLNDISCLIIPKDKLSEIQGIIREFGLEKHTDFILYLVSKVQEVYVREIEYSERPEEVKRIKNLPAEVENLITALEAANDKGWNHEDSYPPQLEQVRFSFNTLGHIKINDHHLTSSIVDAIIEHWDQYSRKDWKKQLRGIPSTYNDNQRNKQFRPRLATALHQFFTEQKVFELKGKKILDSEAYCIARLMDVAGLPLYNREGKPHDIIIDKANVISLIKTWCNRTELPSYPSHYPINPDFDKLYKYFDNDFINSVGTLQHHYELGTAFTICDRFELMDHMAEIAHIIKCVNHRHSQIGYQFQKFEEVSKVIPELKGLISLLNAIEKDQDAIQSISIQFKDETVTLKSDLIKHLILQAVRNYKAEHPEEFEWDIWKTTITDNPKEGSYSLQTHPELNTPSERFLPQFCRSFYNYLFSEVPPVDNDLFPSHKYRKIIAVCLQKAWAFSHQRDPEEVIESKVDEWLKLTEK